MFGLSVGLPSASPLRPPAPLGRHAGQHAGLGGADGRGPDGVGRLRGVPQVGQHVHAAPSRSRPSAGTRPCRSCSCRWTGPSSAWTSRLLPGLAERGQVLAGVAVEHELVGHQLERVPRQSLVPGEPVLRHGLGQVLAGEHESSIWSRMDSRSCSGMVGISLIGSSPLPGDPRRSLWHAASHLRTRRAAASDAGRSAGDRHHPVWGSRAARRQGVGYARRGERRSSRPATARPVLAPMREPMTVSPG